MPRVAPPQWTEDELRAGRQQALERFIEERRNEGPRAFARQIAEVRPLVVALLDRTNNLRDLTGQVFRDDPEAWQTARYICGPPISQEDLWTLVGGPKFRRVPPELADETAFALGLVIDAVRFPWLAENRDPTDAERQTAEVSTSALRATQLLGTIRRGDASRRQEDAASQALTRAGLVLNLSRAKIEMLDELARGEYSRERVLVSSKCDVPARLHDGRILALECKVSNGPKNGWKRLNREVAGKARLWQTAFGSQVLTGVVIAGVFDLSCLVDAQNAGVTLFWEHDLDALTDFVASSR